MPVPHWDTASIMCGHPGTGPGGGTPIRGQTLVSPLITPCRPRLPDASQGLTFTLAYTFSKQLDDLVGTPRNPFDNSLEKGPGAIDHPHVGSLIFVYHLPFG